MNEPLPLAWAVSGEGRLLRAAVDAAAIGLLPLAVTKIIVDRPSPVEAFAAERGIPSEMIAPGARGDEAFDADMASSLRSSGARWAGLTFNRLVGPKTLRALEGRIFNVHFAALPLFPGFGAIEAALGSGMRIAGVTVHLVDESVDAGPILGQATCGIAPDDTHLVLGRRLFKRALPLVLQILRSLSNGSLAARDGQPVWRPGSAAAGTAGFPRTDQDLAAFAASFCERLPPPT